VKRIDLTGRRFGRWTVGAYVGGGKLCAWACICDCGKRVAVRGAELRGGRSKSCGCLHRELTKSRATKHGMCGTPEYNSWAAMMARCYNPQHAAYENYGGRGISVHEDWHEILSWVADVQTRPPGCSLDRIDVNGDYEPGNVRWADAKQQVQNRRPPRKRKLKPAQPPPLNDPPF
jgi:hypothetical protein